MRSVFSLFMFVGEGECSLVRRLREGVQERVRECGEWVLDRSQRVEDFGEKHPLLGGLDELLMPTSLLRSVYFGRERDIAFGREGPAWTAPLLYVGATGMETLRLGLYVSLFY